MRLVVADASPLHYLILVDVADILSHLFETVHIPVEVRDELTCEAAPPDVRTWMQRSPRWIETLPVPSLAFSDPSLRSLGPGERAAIALAKSIAADLLLIDDRAGASAAQRAGFAVTGTFGVLDLASRAGLLDLRTIFQRLQKTNFRYPPSLMEKLLEEERSRQKQKPPK
jgi:predicted nucleic acid-binding protein